MLFWKTEIDTSPRPSPRSRRRGGRRARSDTPYRGSAQPRGDRAVQVLHLQELTKRDKVNFDIFWLKDDALEESANLPAPEIIAADITAGLEAAMEQFATIAEDLK